MPPKATGLESAGDVPKLRLSLRQTGNSGGQGCPSTPSATELELQPFLDRKNLAMVVHALVTCRLNYLIALCGTALE